MSEFLTPRLLITDYYDSLINKIDIYTEKRIKKVQQEILPTYIISSFDFFKNRYKPNYGVEALENPYDSEKAFEAERKQMKFTNELKEIEDKFNEVRQKAIDSIRKVRDENLEYYNANKEKFKVDRTNLTKEKLEELKSQLFANGFCFLLNTKMLNRNKLLFNLSTVVTDFYLRESGIDYIVDELDSNNFFKPKTRFDQRLFVAHQLAKYLKNGISNEFEVINVKRNSFLDVEHINFEFKRAFDEFLFDTNFSTIKSLNIKHTFCHVRISDFSAFANLEYLYISNFKLCERPFENLHKLVKIDMEYCDLSEFDFDSLNSLTSLQIIYIETFQDMCNKQCSLKIDLNRLINLKWLKLDLNEKNNFELISSSFNQLTTLKLKHKTIDFSNQLDFLQLKCLEISRVDLSKQISQQWFNGLGSLIELNLNYTNLKNVDFIDTDLLHNLEILGLSNNIISVLKKNAFSKLKTLKVLNLDWNDLNLLEVGVFQGLEFLEVLNISCNSFDIQSIDKAVFDELKCLQFLRIGHCNTAIEDITYLKREGLNVC